MQYARAASFAVIEHHTGSAWDSIVLALGSEEPEHGRCGHGGLKSAQTPTAEPDAVSRMMWNRR
jgi:hypothetical protein